MRLLSLGQIHTPPSAPGAAEAAGRRASKSSSSVSTRRLREAGIGEAAIASVHTPIGTAIKAVTPEEIAVSITGEMIMVRATAREAKGEVHHGCPMH